VSLVFLLGIKEDAPLKMRLTMFVVWVLLKETHELFLPVIDMQESRPVAALWCFTRSWDSSALILIDINVAYSNYNPETT
ncbi:hypothetical protein ACJX0J_009924, partial [Zea mays]